MINFFKKKLQQKNNTKNDSNINIAGILYPKRKLISDTENCIKYLFELDNGENFYFSLNGIDKKLFSEHNYKDEILAFIGSGSLKLSKDHCKKWSKTFQINGYRVSKSFTLSNGNYLIGLTDENGVFYISLLNKDFKQIADVQKISETFWHNTGISEKNGIIMFAEYPYNSNTTLIKIHPKIYRSKDFGFTWEKVFEQKYPDIKHWHTIDALEKENCWIVTSGDLPQCCKWFLTEDNGDSWIEITDKQYLNQSIHRTVSFFEEKDNYYFSTDDILGTNRDYFTIVDGKRMASAKFCRTTKTNPIKVEELCNLGFHNRAIAILESGYLFFTETQSSLNMQIFYVSKKDLTKSYFLFNILGEKITYGIGSAVLYAKKDNNGEYFYSRISGNLFPYLTCKWEFEKTEKQGLEYNSKDFLKLEEHLWFLDDNENIQNIRFSKNAVEVNIKYKNENINSFCLITGNDSISKLSNNYELYNISRKSNLLEFNFNINSDIAILFCIVEFDNELNMINQLIFRCKNGYNEIVSKTQGKYIKIYFKFILEKQDSIVKISNYYFNV